MQHFPGMSTAKRLIEESWEFAHQNPEHQASAARLVQDVIRIDREYDGTVREHLLSEAKAAFHSAVVRV